MQSWWKGHRHCRIQGQDDHEFITPIFYIDFAHLSEVASCQNLSMALTAEWIKGMDGWGMGTTADGEKMTSRWRKWSQRKRNKQAAQLCQVKLAIMKLKKLMVKSLEGNGRDRWELKPCWSLSHLTPAIKTRVYLLLVWILIKDLVSHSLNGE